MKSLLTLLSLFLLSVCTGQETIHYFDKDGHKIKEKDAVLIVQQLKLNDTLWEFNSYDSYGPRLVSLHTSDEQGTVRNGAYMTYNTEGNRDTIGAYKNGDREGEWRVLAPKGRLLQKLIYSKGQLTATEDSNEVNAQHVAYRQKEDSIRKAGLTDGKGTFFTKVEIESEFPGGSKAWFQYIGQNLHYPKRAQKKGIEGTVILDFIVDKEGHVEPGSVTMLHSIEFSLDKAACDLIRASPDWHCAVQNGRPVKSYKRQPIVFKLPRS